MFQAKPPEVPIISSNSSLTFCYVLILFFHSDRLRCLIIIHHPDICPEQPTPKFLRVTLGSLSIFFSAMIAQASNAKIRATSDMVARRFGEFRFDSWYLSAF